MIRFNKIVSPMGLRYGEQRRERPVVYLDTWALRRIADDAALATRLRDALIWRHGTLAISVLSLLEFASFADPRHAQSVAYLIDSVAPHLFFQDFNAFRVMDREDTIAASGNTAAPDGDVDLLQVAANDGTSGISILPFFQQIARHRTELQTMADAALKDLTEARRLVPSSTRQRALRGSLDTFRRPTATLALIIVFIEDLEGDTPLTRNDAIDLMQATVPSAYCDFVLLDGAWHSRLVKAEKRLRQYGSHASVARSFSGRRHGLEQFFQALETWPR